jgi:hypothetical protein
MAKAFYSTVLDHPADAVWSAIRPFDHYAWSGVAGHTTIEDGKGAAEIGAVRRVETRDRVIRQRLLAHSDLERSYSYELCDPPYLPVRDYVATIRVTPVVGTGQTFVEWSATFDCAETERERWVRFFEKDGFAVWLASLDRHMKKA